MDRNERFKEIRKILNITQKTISLETDVDQSSISKIENGVLKEIPSEIMRYLHNDYYVNLNWLLFGEGEIFIKNTGHHNTSVTHSKIKNIDIDQSENKQVSPGESEIENKYLKQRVKELEDTISELKRAIDKHIEEKVRLLELLAKK